MHSIHLLLLQPTGIPLHPLKLEYLVLLKTWKETQPECQLSLWWVGHLDPDQGSHVTCLSVRFAGVRCWNNYTYVKAVPDPTVGSQAPACWT